MDGQTFLFWAIAGVTCLCAITVALTQHIVRAATWLLFTLAGVAGLFFLLGADFVGATQIIVYVGGTLVLVVFGVMLTAQGPFINLRTGAGEWAVSIVVGLLLYGLLAATVLLTNWNAVSGTPPVETLPTAKESRSSVDLGLALFGFEEATPEGPRTRTAYLLPFEIVSVHLLVVLLGAAYLARAKRRRGAETP